MELRTLIMRAREEDFPSFLSGAITLTLGLYIFTIPFPYKTALQEICFYSSLALLALLHGVRKKSISLETPLTGPFFAFAAWIFVTLFFSIDKRNSFHDYFAYLWKDMALFFLVYNTFDTRKHFILLTWLLIVSAGLLSLGGILYFYWILKMPFEMRIGLPEVGLGVNYIGYVTVLAIFFSAIHFMHVQSTLGTWVSWLCVTGASLATLLTQTKGTFLGFIPLLAVLFEKKRVLVAVLVVVGLLSLVLPVRRLFTTAPEVSRHLRMGRVAIWHNYIQMINDRPWVGIGFGMQTYRKELINPDFEINPSHKEVFAPHNTFMDVAVRCGIPGLVLFLYILAVFYRAGLGIMRNSRNLFLKQWALCLTAVVTSFLIQGFFTDMLLGIQAKYFFILLAMMSILWKWQSDVPDESNAVKANPALPVSQI